MALLDTSTSWFTLLPGEHEGQHLTQRCLSTLDLQQSGHSEPGGFVNHLIDAVQSRIMSTSVACQQGITRPCCASIVQCTSPLHAFVLAERFKVQDF